MSDGIHIPAVIEYGRMLAARDTFQAINDSDDSEKAKAVRAVRFAINRVLDLLSREIHAQPEVPKRKAVKRAR